jgi:hypothetical protein
MIDVDSSTGTPERRLWSAVVLHTLGDARNERTTRLERDRVAAWVGTRDFREVCYLAGIDTPSKVAAHFHTALKRGYKGWFTREKLINEENCRRRKMLVTIKRFRAAHPVTRQKDEVREKVRDALKLFRRALRNK